MRFGRLRGRDGAAITGTSAASKGAGLGEGAARGQSRDTRKAVTRGLAAASVSEKGGPVTGAVVRETEEWGETGNQCV